MKKNFDYDAGHHRYKGVITDVMKEFTDDVDEGVVVGRCAQCGRKRVFVYTD